MRTKDSSSTPARTSIWLLRLVSHIDCSKDGNKGDILAIIMMCQLVILFLFSLWLGATQNTFYAGFVSATIIWKWRDWIYRPTEQLLDKIWPNAQADS